MNDKEFNLQILSKLIEIANYVFNNLITLSVDGTYTASELSKDKDSLGNCIGIKYNVNDTHEVVVGDFKGSFKTDQVFDVLARIEKLCRVKNDNKTKFTYGVKTNETIREESYYLDKDRNLQHKNKKLTKVSERIALEKDGESRYKIYYLFNGVWYQVTFGEIEYEVKRIIDQIEKYPDLIFNLLSTYEIRDEFPIGKVYKVLMDAMGINSERCENKEDENNDINDKNESLCNHKDNKDNDNSFVLSKKYHLKNHIIKNISSSITNRHLRCKLRWSIRIRDGTIY